MKRVITSEEILAHTEKLVWVGSAHVLLATSETVIEQCPKRKSHRRCPTSHVLSPFQMCLVSLSEYLGTLPLWHHLELVVVLWLLIRGADTIVNEVDQLMYR